MVTDRNSTARTGKTGKSAPTRKAPGISKRDAILAAALDEFSARGFEACRLEAAGGEFIERGSKDCIALADAGRLARGRAFSGFARPGSAVAICDHEPSV